MPAGVAEDTLLLVPVREMVLFPAAVSPLLANRAMTAAALQEAARAGRHIALVLQRDPAIDQPGEADLYTVGTEARLLRYVSGADGSHNAIVQGIGRVRVLGPPEGEPFATVRVERIAEPEAAGAEVEARFVQLRERALEALDLIEGVPPELAATVRGIEQPGLLADLVTGLLPLAPAEKQEVLETVSLPERLDRVRAAGAEGVGEPEAVPAAGVPARWRTLVDGPHGVPVAHETPPAQLERVLL